MNRLCVFAWACLLFLGIGAEAADSRIDGAKRHLLDRSTVYLGPRQIADTFSDSREEILARRDPCTSFETFIYGIERRKTKLLSEEQMPNWDAMMAKHNALKQRLHDERNSIRVQELAGEWTLAVLIENAEIQRFTRKLDQWLDLHLEYVFQEEIAHQRFRRAAWNILTAEQRSNILSGGWDSYTRKSTGHKRKYGANKMVTRGLGKPERLDEFNELAERQAAAHHAVHEAYSAAETRRRKLTFAMDLNSEAMLIVEWPKYREVFREFLIAQRRDIRALAQAGYDMSDPKNRESAAKAGAAFHEKAREKFSDDAGKLLSILYPAQ